MQLVNHKALEVPISDSGVGSSMRIGVWRERECQPMGSVGCDPSEVQGPIVLMVSSKATSFYLYLLDVQQKRQILMNCMTVW